MLIISNLKNRSLKGQVTMTKKILIFALIFSVCICATQNSAEALRITLKRVVFEGPKRAEVITIINNTDKEKTYRLGWRHFKMTPDKSLVAIPDDELTPDIKPVVDMVRFAPRRFTMPPKSSQQVRMMLRIPANLEDGEYRSHFWVRPEADVEELRAVAQNEQAKSGGKSGVTLQMLAGVTMPVIVRKGALQATASVESLSARESGGFVDVSFSIARAGNRSLYGDIDYICNPGVGEYAIKVTRGIALYTEVDQRNFNFRIEKAPDQPRCNTLSIVFSESDGFIGDKKQVLAQARASVAQ